MLSLGFHRLSIKRIVRRETNASILLAERVKEKSGHYKVALLISYKVKGVVYRAKKFVHWSSKKESRLRSRQLLKKLRGREDIRITYQLNNPSIWHINLTRAASR